MILPLTLSLSLSNALVIWEIKAKRVSLPFFFSLKPLKSFNSANLTLITSTHSFVPHALLDSDGTSGQNVLNDV